ncbi:hypothetical protein GMJLKIPL_5621 [Methylobacterium isbiliense]|uniref:Uncharacterized protein n=1 Tax=Methylobacterium isbiliense TaxID=315478 RepID=A0ABQ4SM92_9HYPH|nr:hypothetical protein GMJLKIPL_5621 [Methylobacterium isbiliense]
MDKADRKRPPRQTAWVFVLVRTSGMRLRVTTVGMRMNMHLGRRMTVAVKMYPITPDAIEQVAAKTHKHQTNDGLEQIRSTVGHGLGHEKANTADDEKGYRVADAPDDAVPYNRSNATLAGGDTGDRCDVVGLNRVLHAYEETQGQTRYQHAETSINGSGWRGSYSIMSASDGPNLQASRIAGSLASLAARTDIVGQGSLLLGDIGKGVMYPFDDRAHEVEHQLRMFGNQRPKIFCFEL